MNNLTNNKILITGVVGGLASICAKLIHTNFPHVNIVGVDNRECKDSFLKSIIDFKKLSYSRNDFEKIFREHRFDYVLHLGRPSHITGGFPQDLTKRLNFNLMGTNKILDLSLDSKVRKIIILSTFHVYGALADNPVFIKEDAVLKAAIKYPELRDVVEMDQIATNWMWRVKDKMEVVVLRPCNIIGPKINNTMSKYLTSHYSPLPIDYNPMLQFIHEFDMANIILKSINLLPGGAYNVAAQGVISLKQAKLITQAKSIPVPLSILEKAVEALNFSIWKFPHYLINYLKYSCILDTSEIEKYISTKDFEYDSKRAVEVLRSKS